MPAGQVDGWGEYRKLVLAEIDRLTGEVKGLSGKLDALNMSLTRLEEQVRFKAGLWGAVGAAIPAVGAVLFMLLR